MQPKLIVRNNIGKTVLIDSHLHIGLNNRDEDALIRYLDENQIDKAWILTWDEMNPVAPSYYIPLSIDEVKKAYEVHPDRIVPFYAPDPARADWKERLTACLDEGFAGCGELKVPYLWNDKKVEELLHFLNDRELPLVFHMEQSRKLFIAEEDKGMDWLMKRLINERFNGVATRYIKKISAYTGILKKYFSKRMIDFPGYLPDFGNLEEAVKRYRKITFIAHGPHVWNNISVLNKDYLFAQKGKIRGKGITWKLLEKYDNFYCDISGFSGYNALSRDKKKSFEFLDTLHRKVLFGTDNMSFDYLGLIKTFKLDRVKEEDILFKNALRVVN